jgi:hydroxymethylpyrimidine pyrophosphatase-like HAD family hydrolase
MFKMIVFDLDWTLTLSRSPMDSEMIELFQNLLKKYRIWIISWWWYWQFQKQVVNLIWNDNSLLKNLYLCPTCSTKMYLYKEKWFEEIYSLDLTNEEKNYIINTLKKAIIELKLEPEQTWWNTIDDRDTQISYVILWIDATYGVKSIWDPNFEKRKKILEKIKWDFNDYDVLIAWTTTIDITRKWVNKAFWLNKLMDISWIWLNEIIFVWDAIFPWWNDYPPLEMWITCKRVFSVEDTKKFIKNLLKN